LDFKEIRPMKRKFILALSLAFYLLTQTSNAATALAVASNGKWAIGVTPTPSIADASAKAIAGCVAKGGINPQIVWSWWGGGDRPWGSDRTTWTRVKGAVAVSDNGNGNVVGWCFNDRQNHRMARRSCLAKGGKNPLVTDIGK
jgi:hypothetical protein